MNRQDHVLETIREQYPTLLSWKELPHQIFDTGLEYELIFSDREPIRFKIMNEEIEALLVNLPATAAEIPNHPSTLRIQQYIIMRALIAVAQG